MLAPNQFGSLLLITWVLNIFVGSLLFAAMSTSPAVKVGTSAHDPQHILGLRDTCKLRLTCMVGQARVEKSVWHL